MAPGGGWMILAELNSGGSAWAMEMEVSSSAAKHPLKIKFMGILDS
ncbi:MAG: hypothetical protein ACJA0Z_001172 [Halioglobus sp.]|jgi:hypothetical protein